MAVPAGRQPALVNKQYNSPMPLYSDSNVREVLNKQTQMLENGAVGIDFHQLSAPGHLANSAVLKMLAEEERQRGGRGKEANDYVVDNAKPRRRLRRYVWPPPEDGIGKGVNNVVLRHPLLSSYRSPATIGGVKRVEWPPAPDQQDFIAVQPVYSKGPEGNFASTLPRQAPRAWEPPTSQSPQPYQQPPQPYQQPAEPYQAYQPYQPPPFEPPPTTIALRPEPPISQKPAPVFTSQPAATRAAEPKMRGDEKWPPVEYKERAQAENEARVALARGPAVRPRKVKRDYSKFFAQNALTPNYPSYKAPPGTQHYVEEGTSNF